MRRLDDGVISSHPIVDALVKARLDDDDVHQVDTINSGR